MTPEAMRAKALEWNDLQVLSCMKASVECPHCHAEQGGWVADPRGREQTCDECHKPYRVAADAEVKIG